MLLAKKLLTMRHRGLLVAILLRLIIRRVTARGDRLPMAKTEATADTGKNTKLAMAVYVVFVAVTVAVTLIATDSMRRVWCWGYRSLLPAVRVSLVYELS